jgi:hypothetical protein
MRDEVSGIVLQARMLQRRADVEPPPFHRHPDRQLVVPSVRVFSLRCVVAASFPCLSVSL